jgi:HK97 family phage prohead protease
MDRQINLPKAWRDAEVRAQSFNETENTVDVIWTTGATVRRRSWMDGPYDEELVVSDNSVRLGRLNAGAPFLDSHQSYSLDAVLGSVVPGTARIERGKGVATIKLTEAPGAADRVFRIKEGVVRNVSVGYRAHVIEKQERDDGSVPLWRVTDWEPMEISAVTIPADDGSQIRSETAEQQLFSALLKSDRASVYLARARMNMAGRRLGAR